MQNSLPLAQLPALADKGPALRSPLVEERTDLLAFWPDDCPKDMGVPCESLLSHTRCETDDAIRAVALPASRMQPNDNLASTLIEMARMGLDVRTRLAEALKLSRSRLEEILATDHGLALVCKGLGLSRTTFSTLTMLIAGKTNTAQCYAALDIYDAVTPEALEDLRTALTGSVINFPRAVRDARAS